MTDDGQRGGRQRGKTVGVVRLNGSDDIEVGQRCKANVSMLPFDGEGG